MSLGERVRAALLDIMKQLAQVWLTRLGPSPSGLPDPGGQVCQRDLSRQTTDPSLPVAVPFIRCRVSGGKTSLVDSNGRRIPDSLQAMI